MVKILVCKDDLDLSAKQLMGIVEKFDVQLKILSTAIGKISGGWTDDASSLFIAKATTYLQELTSVRNAILEYATSFSSKPSSIKEPCDKYASLATGGV